MAINVATVIFVQLIIAIIFLKLYRRFRLLLPNNHVVSIKVDKKDDKIVKNDYKNDENYEAIIIGAGVVGATLAVVLARQGRRILVLERQLGDNVDKNKIIGELLQPSGTNIVEKLGLKRKETFYKNKKTDFTKKYHVFAILIFY